MWRSAKRAARLCSPLVVAVVLSLLPARQTQARVNPLKVMMGSKVRAEIVVAIDVSGSMAADVNSSGWANSNGHDCLGNRKGTVDFCGDGLCSGVETTGNCAADCTLTDNASPSTSGSAPAGGAEQCLGGANYISRLGLNKDALRGAMASSSKSAAFALVSFGQSGYYQYWKGTNAKPTKAVPVLLAQHELIRYGGWSSGPAPFTWPAGGTYTGAAMTLVPAIVTPDGTANDSLYRRKDDATKYARFPYATAGDLYTSGGYTWEYAGSYYSYLQWAVDTTAAVRMETVYLGPQFSDGTDTWVHNRFRASTSGLSCDQGVCGTGGSHLVEPFSTSTVQNDQDLALGAVLAQLSTTANGGPLALGGTPLAANLDVAKQLFIDREAGTGTYAGQADTLKSCRTRMVLLLTDGTSWDGNPVTSAAAIYALNTTNRIKTYVIGFSGADITGLDSVAAAGGTGTAKYAASGADLVKLINSVLSVGSSGDYVVSAPATGTASGGSGGTIVFMPSAEYPSWKGHLRAQDQGKACTADSDCTTKYPDVGAPGAVCLTGTQRYCQLWDAQDKLTAKTWSDRLLYTGYPQTFSGADLGKPIPMFNSSGTVNLTGSGFTPSSAGVKTVWPGTPPSDTEITNMVKWLAGNGRTWKLPGIVRSIPVYAGPPPSYNTTGHSTFGSTYATRQKLVYVASDEGLLHAFDVGTGGELFAYIPPDLLPTAYDIYKNQQSGNPDQHKWTNAGSPRVEDMADGSAAWKTILIQTLGPGGKTFVALDITDPSTYNSATKVYTAKTPPFTLVFHSGNPSSVATVTSPSFGETWSVPAVGYKDSSGKARVAMGSGYGTGTQGHYYNVWKENVYFGSSAWDTSKLDTSLMSPATPKVDYGVVPDTAMTIDESAGRVVLATYQADLMGRIVRFAQGVPGGSDLTIIAANALQPFEFAPAALYRPDDAVTTIAAVSGALQEDSDWMTDAGFTSTMYIRTDNGSAVQPTNERLTCAVTNLCSCFSGGTVASNCATDKPGTGAVPADRPILVQNTKTGKVEAFFLYYEPSTTVSCAANLGTSYLIRISLDTGTAVSNLVSITKYTSFKATGMVIVGGGGQSDISVAGTGSGGPTATRMTPTQDLTGGTTGAPAIELWREVR